MNLGLTLLIAGVVVATLFPFALIAGTTLFKVAMLATQILAGV